MCVHSLRMSANKRAAPVEYLASAKGLTWFLYKGHAIILTNEQAPVVNTTGEARAEVPTLAIRCFWFSANPLKVFLNDCRANAVAQETSTTLCRKLALQGSGTVRFSKTQHLPKRPIETVDIEKKKKDGLLDDIADFLRPEARAWFGRRGIPYQRGYLFYGTSSNGICACFVLANNT